MQDMEELGSVPKLGTALPVVCQARNVTNWPAVGSWVKIKNLGARAVQGQLQVRSSLRRPGPAWNGQMC